MAKEPKNLAEAAAMVREYAQTRIDFAPAAKLSAAEIGKILGDGHEATTLMGAKRIISRWCREKIEAMPPEEAAKYSNGPKRKPKLV